MRISDAAHLAWPTPPDLLSLDEECLFINRELSWIEFCRRVLHEAQRIHTPLLERLKFLGILSANVDEFYMKRLGGLKQTLATDDIQRSIDGLTPGEQIRHCKRALDTLQAEKESTYRLLRKEMQENDIHICEYTSLEKADKEALSIYYRDTIEPHIAPLSIDSNKPFPFLFNLSLYLLVSTRCLENCSLHLSLINIPSGPNLSRFIPIGNTHTYLLLEDLIAENLKRLFPSSEILTTNVFRITRSAVSYRDYAELDDQREMIEEELHDRQHASVIRLQVCPRMSPSNRAALARSLYLDAEQDVSESAELIRMSDLRELASLNIPSLRDTPLNQHINTDLEHCASIFESVLRQTNILLQHPYESFTESVEQFVREASHHPEVVAIKMTLYRTSVDTRIVDYLVSAALSGKHVSVVVELKARFDEASNLRWARRLEHAGVHVSHGIIGLKTHCKFILVLKQEKDSLRRYAHIGSGNYHAGTAQLYTDLGLLTCDHDLTADVDKLFAHLIRPSKKAASFKSILAAPQMLKSALLEKIDREIRAHSSRSCGYICLKTNALEDPDITLALYRASQAGVRINLIVRDICRVRPGIYGISENITVISIVGRFLEHSRLYLFGNEGKDEIYIGSADLMTRNLEKRAEILIPITDERSKSTLRNILCQYLLDNCNAWHMLPDGEYYKKQPPTDHASSNSQRLVVGEMNRSQDVLRSTAANASSSPDNHFRLSECDSVSCSRYP